MIRVLDKQGNGVPNKMIFAQISYANGPLPYFYQRYQHGYVNKLLIKPLSGLYNPDYQNPLLMNAEAFIPSYTDANGYYTYDDLKFSQYGPNGEYKITFRCEGA